MHSRKIMRLVAAALAGAGFVAALTFIALQASNASDDFEPAISINNTLEVNFEIGLQRVAGDFRQPTFLTHAGDSSRRMFITEKVGRILILRDGQRIERPFLDISDIVRSQGYEQGLLGLAFHPEYRNNGLFYVNYTDRNGSTVVAEYRVSANDPNLADPGSARLVLTFNQPFQNHNGGMIAFGPDKYLYIGTGDGGGAGDPLRAGQNLKTWLGKILRIDVNGDPYAIPPDNPYADGREGLPEIWSYGWRNPWRFAFDRLTGDKYIADVGQNAYEEVNVEKAGSPGGLNYGWNIMEGLHCYPRRENCNQEGLVLPVAEYDHSLGNSITGGYVYRGQAFPRMQGTYFFADFGSTRIWAMQETRPNVWAVAEVGRAGFPVSSFGEDESGEIYLLDFGQGGIYRLVDTGN